MPIFVKLQGSLCGGWSVVGGYFSRGLVLPTGGLALAVFHVVLCGSLLLLISSYILLLISANVLLLASLVSPCASALQLFPVVCTALDVAGEAGATGPP